MVRRLLLVVLPDEKVEWGSSFGCQLPSVFTILSLLFFRFRIIVRFIFSRYIVFLCIYIVYIKCITNIIYVEKLKVLQFVMVGLLANMQIYI